MEYGISGYQSDYRLEKKTVVQLAHEEVSLTGSERVDHIYLLGTKVEDRLIYTDIVLVLENGETGEKQFYPIPTSKGMGGGIDVVDFTHNGIIDVGVYILSGGTGNQVDYYIFFNQGESVKLGFSNKVLEEKLKFRVTYLPNYQVEVKDLNTNKATILDLSQRSSEYLSAIYNPKGELKSPLLGAVAPISDSNTINSKNAPQGHDLILTQRILGRSHNDILGYIQSYIGFDQGKYYVYRTLISQ
ncbi:MAG: hypothetical protein K2G70_05030 [Turicibacter sp.]|nr:hypothetical protein [Turicibacter sp.]